jgi:hypothetical protein
MWWCSGGDRVGRHDAQRVLGKHDFVGFGDGGFVVGNVHAA